MLPFLGKPFSLPSRSMCAVHVRQPILVILSLCTHISHDFGHFATLLKLYVRHTASVWIPQNSCFSPPPGFTYSLDLLSLLVLASACLCMCNLHCIWNNTSLTSNLSSHFNNDSHSKQFSFLYLEWFLFISKCSCCHIPTSRTLISYLSSTLVLVLNWKLSRLLKNTLT